MRLLTVAVLALIPSVALADLRAEIEADWLRELTHETLEPNESGEARGAHTWQDAAGAVDGVKNGAWGFHTIFSANPWWQVDLLEPTALDRILVYNRQEGGSIGNRTIGMKVLVSLDGDAWTEVYQHSGEAFGGALAGTPLVVDLSERDVTPRYVRCQMEKEVSFHLDEVEVYASADPNVNIALDRPADQSSSGRWSTAKPNAVNPDGEGEVTDTAAIIAARWEARAETLSDPLLNFDDILFVKRHPGTFAHMCDQYYGCYARPGGGLFVLEDIAGEPTVRDIVGDQLPTGSFLSPGLSYDAKRVAFAYVPVPDGPQKSFSDKPEHCYNIYTINLDGTGLRKLTDGPWDDFDPVWLPDGDIAFISARRGGFCRCGGRPVPTYTLHRMKPDGSSVRRMSSHETNEWHPAVGNDGSLLYTRWDYVDRHTNLAHSLWSCRPDGSAPLAVFGNYNYDKKPWGEWHPEPIPNSHKLMAIAGAHHGYAYGSLVMIDPRRAADGLDAVERLTPSVAFPEAEGFPNEAYTTPRGLSEDLWLVSYSPNWSTGSAAHTVTQGIYVQGRDTPRELLYRDPEISSMGAIPVRPSALPPIHPDVADASLEEGRFVVFDAYDSTDALPDEKITHLRVIQILPKTTFRNDSPKISVATQISARALLGTVPVEDDGSAYFTAPANVPVYFQSVGADGRAIQSMRSLTYLQPGETQSCVGCHEPRNSVPADSHPAALRRPPSVIEPGPDGSRPFSYPRLVQPVLDRHCVSCHGADDPDGGVRLTGEFADGSPHSRSYVALAQKKLVHWFDSVNGGEWIPRTTPGQFGARASKLMDLLRDGQIGRAHV